MWIKIKHFDHFCCKFNGILISICEGTTSTQISISLYLFTNHFQTCELQGFYGSVYLGYGLLECDAMEYSNH